MTSARSYDLRTIIFKGTEEPNQGVRQPIKILRKRRRRRRSWVGAEAWRGIAKLGKRLDQ